VSQSYAQFLASKAVKAKHRGLARVPDLAVHLRADQRNCVDHHLRIGAAGCFLDTGMGKTEIQLEFCQRAMEATNLPVLIWTPLAVAAQTKRRAERWGYEAAIIRDQSEARAGIINICNYDRRDKLDLPYFGIVSCDEASILKSFTGVTTRMLIAAHKSARFKLVASATPAPNDHMEFGNYAEFCDSMAANEMLSRFFINDTSTASQKWRLKCHAVTAFWDWMSSWTRMAERPSDLGGDDIGFDLPSFEIIRHVVKSTIINRNSDDLFGSPSLSATDIHDVKRQTGAARAEAVGATVAAEPNETWLIYCDTNYEADALRATIPSAIEVRGSQSIEEKEEKLLAFSTGAARHLIVKPSMCFGLDWAHCARMAFVGRSYSYETWYQAIRRCWRYGQKRALKVHLAVADGEIATGNVIDRKAGDHVEMKMAMRASMKRAIGQVATVKSSYVPKHTAHLEPWICVA